MVAFLRAIADAAESRDVEAQDNEDAKAGEEIMSEPAPEPQGGGAPGGGFMSKKFLGIPAVVWLIGAAILAYLYFRNSSSSGSSGTGASSSAGSGQSTTGDITFTPGTSTVEVQGNTNPSTQQNTTQTTNNSGTPNPQPTPNPKPPTKSSTGQMKSYTVKKGQSLDEIAKQFGIDAACLAHNNVYVKGEVPGNKKVGRPLGTGAGLKTGQVLKIPTNTQCKQQGYKS